MPAATTPDPVAAAAAASRALPCQEGGLALSVCSFVRFCLAEWAALRAQQQQQAKQAQQEAPQA